MPRLSTHVLDTARGKPAQNVRIDLHRCDGERRHIKSVATNADGRTAEPLLSGDRLETGIYELTFHAGDYFRSAGVALSGFGTGARGNSKSTTRVGERA